MRCETFSNGLCFAEIQEEVSAKVLEFLESPFVTRDVVLTDNKVWPLIEILSFHMTPLISIFLSAWGHKKWCQWLEMYLDGLEGQLYIFQCFKGGKARRDELGTPAQSRWEATDLLYTSIRTCVNCLVLVAHTTDISCDVCHCCIVYVFLDGLLSSLTWACKILSLSSSSNHV